jgi:hypothetical protein
VRYFILLALNLPIVLLAFINIVTQYKMNRVTRSRFRFQITLWFVILLILFGSFPIYNIYSDKALFDSSGLSLFDIVQTTVLIVLIYTVNNLRQKIERAEKTTRNLHQELSIVLSKYNGKS